MGLVSIIRKTKLKEKEKRVLILGLDNSGKSTLIARWFIDVDISSDKAANDLSLSKISPTFGFEIKTIQLPNIRLVLWDIGGQKSLRPYWRTYYEDASDALIWVIDSTDTSRLAESMDELRAQLVYSKSFVLAILLNKQDLPDAVGRNQVDEWLKNLLSELKLVKWRLFSGSALKGTGDLQEAFNWIVESMTIYS